VQNKINTHTQTKEEKKKKKGIDIVSLKSKQTGKQNGAKERERKRN
jgi:hypothetical protein